MTRCLLDTHALIWWWSDDAQLSSVAHDAITDRANTIYVSSICGIEIALKVRKGELPHLREPLDTFDAAFAEDGFEVLPVTYRHARDAGLLAGDHRDPFDRIIAAQGLLEDLTILTKDREITRLGARTLW